MIKITIFFCFLLTMSLNGYSQTRTNFTVSNDVFNYLDGKTFTNPNFDLELKVDYRGIFHKEKQYYFNISITVISPSRAIIKAQSVTNPDGVIKYYLDSRTGCMSDGDTELCSILTRKQ